MFRLFPLMGCGLFLLPSAAHASACVFTGSVGAYVLCLTDEVTTLQAESTDLAARLTALEGSTPVVTGTEPITVTKTRLSYRDPILTYTSSDGTEDTLDLSSPVAGTVVVGPNDLVAVEWGLGGRNTRLYFDLTGGSADCTLIATDSDDARAFFFWGTDIGNNVSGIWGRADVPTFILARDGWLGNPLDDLADFGIICF